MEDRMTVPVRVPKYIRDYIRGINADSDVVVPEYHSLLWATVKANLDLVPRDGLPPLNPESTYIHITIYSSKHRKIYNIASGKIIRHSDVLFRCHLSEDGQKAVSDYIVRGFKQDYRSYMSGALGNNPDLSIKDAIEEFCNDRNVEMDDALTYDMLRKDWYRFRRSCENRLALKKASEM